MDLIDGLPARCSHRSVRPGKSKGFQRDDGLQQMLGNFLPANMFQGGQQDMGALCNLQFNQPTKKGPLLLMDKPDEPDDTSQKSEKNEKGTTPPPASAEAKGVDKMAEEIQKQLETNKEEGKQTQASKQKNTKGKASKKKVGTTSSAEMSCKSKAFPGTGAAAPKHFEKATIYTCPNCGG